MSDLSPKSFTKRIAGKVKGFFKQSPAKVTTKIEPKVQKEKKRLPGSKLKKFLEKIFSIPVESSTHCWCGKVLRINNPEQIVHYCCKLHHWARHNKKYLLTARGHK